MSTNESEVKEPLAFMLLWRPWDSISGEGFDWHDEDLPALVESIASGVPARSSWSVSNFPRLIEQGDRVFLRRTSSRPVGLVAEGVVASEVYTAPSYKDNGRDMSYVDIDWLALAPDDPLGPEGLRDTIPALTTRWAGAIYDRFELEALDKAWATHLAGLPASYAVPEVPLTRPRLREERTFQGQFRRAVLDAHGARCFFCGIQEESILDAAHLVAHAAGGRPTAENGRPLCANHHRAFDRLLIHWDPARKAFDWVDPDRRF